MNITTKIGTVSSMVYTTEKAEPDYYYEKLTFTLTYGTEQTVKVECIDQILIKEVKGKFKDSDRVTVIGLTKGSVYILEENTTIRGIGIILPDETVHPKDFGKELAYQYRESEIRIQKILSTAEQFADEDDPF